MKWFTRRKESPEIHRQQAWELFRADDYRGARDHFEKWCAIEPESASAWFGYGWTSFAVMASDGVDNAENFKTCAGMFERCIRLNDATLELTPSQLSAAHWQLAWALELGGEIHDARSHFEVAVKLAPHSDLAVEALKKLATFAFDDGDLAKAAELLEAAAKIHPNDKKITENLEEIKRRRQGIQIVFRMFLPLPGVFTAVWVHPDETLGDIAARVLRDHGLQYNGGSFQYWGDDALPYYLDHGFRESDTTVRALGMKDRDELFYLQLIEAPGAGETDSFDIKCVREHLQKGRDALARREIRRVIESVERNLKDHELERAEARLAALVQLAPNNQEVVSLQDRVRVALVQRDSASESSVEGDWCQSHGNGSRTGRAAIDLAPPLSVAWEFIAHDPHLTPPVATGDAVYVASWDQHLYCLDAETGAGRWRWQARTVIEQAPIVHRGRVLIMDREAFYCLSGRTGHIVWQSDGCRPRAAVLVDDRIYVADASGILHCVASETGEELSRLVTSERELHSIAARGTRIVAASSQVVLAAGGDLSCILWKRAGRFDDAVPVLANQNVYIGTFAEGLWCLQQDSGRIEWIFGTEVPIRAAPAAARGRIFFCDTGGRFGCLDGANGEMLWSPRTWMTTKSSCSTAPVLAGRWLYVLLDDGVLYCLDALTGAEWWRCTVAQWKSGVRSLAVNGTSLLCATSDGKLRSLSRQALNKSSSRDSTPPRKPPELTNLPPLDTNKSAIKPDGNLRDYGRPTSLSKGETGDFLQALHYLITDRLDEGIAILRTLERYHPDEGIILQNLGNAYEWKGLVGDALATFDHILALYPDDVAAFSALGRLLRTHTDIVKEIYGQTGPTGLQTVGVPKGVFEHDVRPMIVGNEAVICCQAEKYLVELLGDAPAWFWWQLNELLIYPVLRLYLEFDYQPYRSKDWAATLDVGNAETQKWLTLLETQETIRVHILDRAHSCGCARSLNFAIDQRDRLRRLNARAQASLRAIPVDRRDFHAASEQVEVLWKEEGGPQKQGKTDKQQS